jgi:hypothetical protein
VGNCVRENELGNCGWAESEAVLHYFIVEAADADPLYAAARADGHRNTRLEAISAYVWKLLAASVGGSDARSDVIHGHRTRRSSKKGARDQEGSADESSGRGRWRCIFSTGGGGPRRGSAAEILVLLGTLPAPTSPLLSLG